jgi:RNA polymerase sigma-32 factor
MAFRRGTNELAAYSKIASKTAILTREQEKVLARRWRDERDPEALDRLVLCNLKAVFKIAGEFRNRHAGMEDLVQEGLLGLIRATERFDPERGIRFLSYAGWWIRAYIKEYLLRSRSLVRIGTTQKQRSIYSRLGRAKAMLEKLYPDLDPSLRYQKLAEILDASPELVEDMNGRLSGHDLSLDARISDDGETAYVDLLADDGPDTEERAMESDLHQHRVVYLLAAMDELTDREQLIIQRRYLDPSSTTLRELGVVLGISRERVRQLEMRAKEKIRTSFEAQEGAAELLAG